MNSDASKPATPTIFSERLLPTIGSFIASAIIWPSVWLVFLPINEAVGSVLGAGLTLVCWLTLIVTSARITVGEGLLAVGRARIPVKFLAVGREIEGEQRFAERGPKLNALAFVRFQAGVKPLVRFDVIDIEDPTPYWLISTRRPAKLIAAVEAARQVD